MRSQMRDRVEFGQPTTVADGASGWTRTIVYGSAVWADVSTQVTQDAEGGGERSMNEITVRCRWFNPIPTSAWCVRHNSLIYQVETAGEEGKGRERMMIVTATRRG